MSDDRILPQCPGIEKAIMASFIVCNDTFLKYSMQVSEKDFYIKMHQELFAYMTESTITDMIILSEKFPAYSGEIAGLMDSTATTEALEAMIETLKDRAYRRRQIAAMSNALETLYSDFDLSAAAISEKTVQEISEVENLKEKPQSIQEIMPEMMNQFETICTGQGIKTGLSDIDLFLGPMIPGDYILLGGRPSMGKTSLALHIIRKAARDGYPSLIFSMDTTKNILCARMCFSETKTSLDKALKGNAKELSKMVALGGPCFEFPIYTDASPDITVGHIQSVTKYYVKKFGVKLVVVDHIGQILANSNNGKSRNDELTQISKGLKAVGLRNSTPMLILSQLSRAVENRTPPRPILSDLRDSGSLEQDAEKIIFIYREEQWKRDSDKKGIAEIIVAKNKNGQTGYDEVLFDKDTMTFKNLEKNYSGEGRTDF